VEKPLRPERQAFAHINRAWVAVYAGPWALAGTEVSAAIQAARSSAHPDALTALALQLRALLLFAPGAMEPVERYCQWVLARSEGSAGPVQAGAYSLMGALYLLQARLEESSRATERARAISKRLGGFVFLDMEIDYVYGYQALIRADYRAMEHELRKRLPLYEGMQGYRQWLACALLGLGRILWLEDRLEEAHEVYAQMVAAEVPQDLPENHFARAILGSLLAFADGQVAVAETGLRRALGLQERAPYTHMFGNAGLLLACLYLRRNQPQDAMAQFRPLLADYEQRGVPGLMLAEGASIIPLLRRCVEEGFHTSVANRLLGVLDRAGEIRPVAVPHTGETLTPREVEVLRLVMAGASNRDIADQLVVTQRTVKSHMTSIMRKLDVSSRTQAATRAREWKLV
jgi:ATP/maltotriose-dependent transcriptional regulator MalT